MDITEVIKKVKANLKTQEELKAELQNEEESLKLTEEKISFSKENLLTAEQDELLLKEEIIKELQTKADELKDNLLVYLAYTYGDNQPCGYGIFAKFMGKKQGLLANDYILTSNKNPREVSVGEFADKIFKDYLAKGETIFNEENMRTLLEVKKLYDTKPEIIVDKLVTIDLNKQVSKIQNRLNAAKVELSENVDELKDVEEKISKTKEFKSEFLKKIFNKKAKLEEKRQRILRENAVLNKNVDELESQLNDKANIKEKSVEYVNAELNSLMRIFDWVDGFEVGKIKLFRYRAEHVDLLNRQIEDSEEKLANTYTRIKELKGMLQLNKKVNNETVINALKNKFFIDQLNAFDPKELKKDSLLAYKFIENKYHDYLQGYVEKLVK